MKEEGFFLLVPVLACQALGVLTPLQGLPPPANTAPAASSPCSIGSFNVQLIWRSSFSSTWLPQCTAPRGILWPAVSSSIILQWFCSKVPLVDTSHKQPPLILRQGIYGKFQKEEFWQPFNGPWTGGTLGIFTWSLHLSPRVVTAPYICYSYILLSFLYFLANL